MNFNDGITEVYRWKNAPQELKKHSVHGGDETWMIIQYHPDPEMGPS